MKRYLTTILGAFILLTSCNHKRENTIELFSNINGIIPGLTKMEDVKKEFGTPDIIDSKEGRTFNNVYMGDIKIVKYTDIGMKLLFDEKGLDNNPVDAITVELPFDGKSKEGIYLGMPREKCLEILDSNYAQVAHYEPIPPLLPEESFEYARRISTQASMQIWFEEGILKRIQLH